MTAGPNFWNQSYMQTMTQNAVIDAVIKRSYSCSDWDKIRWLMLESCGKYNCCAFFSGGSHSSFGDFVIISWMCAASCFCCCKKELSVREYYRIGIRLQGVLGFRRGEILLRAMKKSQMSYIERTLSCRESLP